MNISAEKRFISLLLAVIMVVSFIPLMPLSVFAAKLVTPIEAKVTVSINKDEVALSDGVVTASVAPTYDSCSGSYTGNKATVTITNISGSDAVIGFKYDTLTNVSGEVGVEGATDNEGIVSKLLENNGSIKLTFTGTDGEGAASIKLRDFTYSEIKSVNLTVKVPVNGSYTANGTAVTADTTVTIDNTLEVPLVATPATGYKFAGWYNETTGKYISFSASATLMFDQDAAIVPMFVAESDVVFGINDAAFASLDAALAVANKGNIIRPLKDVTLTKNYTIPAGITLLVPFDDAGTCLTDTTVNYVANTSATISRSVYRTLTLADGVTLTVNGALSVSAKHRPANGSKNWGGTVDGGYGVLKLNGSSKVNIEAGGVLYAFGFVIGDGSVEVKSGATVYENMQMTEFIGGSNLLSGLSKHQENKFFLFSQYYVQNIESDLIINAGANLKVFVSMTVSSETQSMPLTFIGEGGMFTLNTGAYAVKSYDAATDRMTIDTYGDISLSSISMSMSGVPLLGSVTISSADFYLPVNSNITVNVNSGTATINQDLTLLPGSEINIAKGATAYIPAGKQINLFDKDDWGNYVFPSKNCSPVSYIGSTKVASTRTITDDAVININGLLKNEGLIYTSAGGAKIVSTEGDGIFFNASAAPTKAVTLRFRLNGGTESSDWEAKTFNPAWLLNADGTFVETINSAANTGYVYNKATGKWESGDAVVTFEPNGAQGNAYSLTVSLGNILQNQNSATIPPASSLGFTNSTAFIGWNTKADGTGISYSAGQTLTVTESITLYAQWEKPASVEITWIINGVPTTQDGVAVGTVPSYPDGTPAKATDASGHYTFAGWATTEGGEVITLPAVTGTATYYAVFTSAAHNDDKIEGGKHYCSACNYLIGSCNDTNKDHKCDVGDEDYACHQGTLTQQNGQSATCGADGWNAYYQCSCDKFYEDAQAQTLIPDLAAWKTGDGKIPALQHDWNDPTYTWSTDGKSCTAERTCKRDGSHKETETVTATGVVTTDPTCTAMGVTTYTANFDAEWAVDGQTTTRTDVAKEEHDFNTKASDQLATAADCENAATYYVQCDNCDAVSDTKTVAVGSANGHAFNSKASDQLATAADCENAATYYVQCDNCTAVSDTKTVAVGSANGHAFNSKASDQLATAADCENAATYYVQCDNCDAVDTTKTVAVGSANGHAFNSKASNQQATAADCDNAATYYVQCDNCDVVSTDKTVAVGSANGHAFNSKVSNQQATAADCENAATYYVKCDNCDAVDKTQTVAIGSANGHTGEYYFVYSFDESSLSVGFRIYLDCDNCEEEFVISGGGLPTVKVTPTCTEKGVYTYEIDYSKLELQDIWKWENFKLNDENLPEGAVWNEAAKIMNYELTWKTDPNNHENLTPVPAQDATCIATGIVEHWVCSCGKLYSDDQATTEIAEADTIVDKDPTNHAGEKYAGPADDSDLHHTLHGVYCDACDEIWDEENPNEPHVAGEDGYCECGNFELCIDFNGGKISTTPPLEGVSQEVWDSLVESMFGDYEATEWCMFGTGFSEIIIEDGMFVRDGYKLVGIAYDKDGTQPYNGEDITEPTTLYMIWESLHVCAPADYEDNGDGTHEVICSCDTVLNAAEPCDYKTPNHANKSYDCVCGAQEEIKIPEVVVTDIKDTLTGDPDLTFALNFTIKDLATLEQEYIDKVLEIYGSYYTDYVLTIEGLTDGSVTFNANGETDGYLAGRYGDYGWISVPFEDVTVNNGESLYIMEYAAQLMGQSGLRYTLAEVVGIVQNFDCGVYFTPEFLNANPNLKVTLELKVFTEDAEGNKIEDITVAKNVFKGIALPEVSVTDIKDTLAGNDPDLTFALNFAIKKLLELDPNSEEYQEYMAYLNEVVEIYGDYYTDYVLTIEGLTDSSVTFNANGETDGYLAGQYDNWSPNWVVVPFEDVTVMNGESLYIMEYAAKLMGQSGLRFTLAEVAAIVQNFDCGVYFTPEFIAANPGLKVTLELKLFKEDANGNKTNDISVATNVFEVSDIAAIVIGDGKQTEYYESFTAAYNGAEADDTIIMLKDATLDGKLIVAKDITIDGNGHSIIADANTTWYKMTTGIFARKDYYPWVVIQANGTTFADVTIDSNGCAGGVKIENADDVVFDNVSILGAQADAITVYGSLLFKNYLKIETTSSMIDARNGVVNAADGTVFDMTTFKGSVSPATSDLKEALNTEGEPFFCAYNSTSYFVSLTSTTSFKNLVLLKDATLSANKSLTTETFDLNGHTLTIADGYKLTVNGNATAKGNGTIVGEIVLGNVTFTAPAGLNVTSGVTGYEVKYENGVYFLAYTGWEYDGTGTYYVIDNEIQTTGWTEIENAWYYLNPETGYRAEGLTRVPYPTVSINGITYAPDQEALDYCAGKGETFIDETDAWFLFDEYGEFLYDTDGDIGWYEINDANELRYMNHGMLEWHPGLIKNGDDYYYFIGDVVNGGNIAAEGDIYITKNNGIEAFKLGDVYNFAEGKFSGAHGIVDGKYYENSRLMAGNGLTQVGDKFIYVRSNGYVVKNAEYYIPANSLGVASGVYAFDENGYMIAPASSEKNGIVEENDGLYFYENGKLAYNKGLIAYGNGVIYVRSNGQLVVGSYYVTNLMNYNGTGINVGDKLTFGEDGFMLDIKNGIVDGYYYKNNAIVYNAGVIVIDGEYYYVKSTGEVVMGKSYWITNVGNSGVVAKQYTFDANGVFVPKFATDLKNGVVDGYYYVDGNIQYAAGPIEWNGDIYYVRSNGQVATGVYWTTQESELLPSGKHTFDETGKFVTE